MEILIRVIRNISFWTMLVLVFLLFFGWLFHLDHSNILLCLKYVGFTFLVTWFINLLIFKK